MRSRFTCPTHHEITVMQLPEELRTPIDIPELEGTSDVGIRLAVPAPLLRIVENRDLNVTQRWWEVIAFTWIGDPAKEGATRLESMTDFKEGDSPEEIGAEFTRDILKSLIAFLDKEDE